MKLAGEALDEVRKSLRKQGADMLGALWALRGNAWSRSQEQQLRRKQLCKNYPKLGRAMALRDALQDVLAGEDISPCAGGWGGPTARDWTLSANWPAPSRSTFTACSLTWRPA